MIRLKTLLFEDATKESDSTKKLRVLFVGDSQTAANWSYAKVLLRNKLIDGKIVAKNGASTTEVLNMLEDNLTDKYDIVSIMAGGNDGASKTPNNAIKNFEAMFNLVRQAGAKLVVVTNPSKQFIETDDKYYRKDGYPANDKIANWLASQSKADAVIDTQNFDKLDFTKDHVHLDADAHKKIAAEWKAAILSEMPITDKEEKLTDTTTLQKGSIGNSVKKIQTKLIELGFDVGVDGVDGKFGPHTEAGVIAFQKSIGKEPTGELTKSELNNLMNKPVGASGVLSKMIGKITNKDSLSLKSLYGAGTAAAIKPSNVSSKNISDANTVIDFFTGKGLSPEQAAGIAGNIQAESGFNPAAVGDSGKAIGLAQWRDSRRDKLEQWSEDNGVDSASVDGQLKYLWWELTNTEKNALNKLKQQNTPGDAAYAFAKYFERPATINPKRQSAAEAFFLAYK
jgi:peptidoglycan hydrolase-like protein with peptidoglycan-binding domain/lysophospholipase L1-like esterase